MVNLLDIFVKYWLQWVFGLVAAGVILWAKHIIKLEKDSVNRTKAEHSKEMRQEIVDELEGKIDEVRQHSDEMDEKMWVEIEEIENGVKGLTTGVLSLQGKQFKEYCRELLQPGHIITVSEYEDFESEYDVYKTLDGNHKGDLLHQLVVDKFNAQLTTPQE